MLISPMFQPDYRPISSYKHREANDNYNQMVTVVTSLHWPPMQEWNDFNGSQLAKIKKKVDSLHAPAMKFKG